MKSLVFSCCLVFLCFTLAAQHGFPGFTSYTFFNFGFRAGTISSTYQDPHGYLWFCTLGGLDRWDGTNLKHYPYDRLNPRALPESLVSSIIMDKSGRYWLNSQTCLSILDPRLPIDSAVMRITRSPTDTSLVLTDFFNTFITSDEKGNFWIAWRKGGGVLFVKPDKMEFDSKKIRCEDGSEYMVILKAQPDSAGHRMWLVSDKHGFCSIGTDDFKITHYESDIRQELMRIWDEKADILQRTTFFWSKKGYFWCVSGGKQFVKFDVSNRKAEIFEAENGIYPSPPTSQEYFFEDQQGNGWFTLEGQGVLFLDMTTRKCTNFRRIEGDPNSLSGDLCNHITSDRQGNIWISHRYNGVSKFNYRLKKSRSFPPLPPLKNGGSTGLLGFSTDKSGNEFMQNAAGYFIKPVGASSFQKLELPGPGYFFQSAEKEQFLLCEKGLFQISANPSRCSKLPVQPSSETMEIMSGDCKITHEHRDGTPFLWLIESKKGLFKYFLEKGNIELVNQDTTFFGKNHSIQSLRRDSKGNLWVLLTTGFARFNLQTREWEKWLYNNPEDLSFMAVPPYREMFVDSKDRVWFASIENGAVWFDGEKFHSATRAVPGLVPRCYAVAERSNGEIWFTTSRNFVSFVPETGRYKIYKDMGGAQLINFKDDSTVILSNVGEIRYVPLDKPNLSNVRSKTVISELRIFEDDRSDLLNLSEITLPHDQNFLRFTFGTFNFMEGENSRFAYKLEGADADWVEPKDGRSFAAYSTLPPGEYVFRVKSCTADGIWDEIGTSKKITIQPAWWQTRWFYALIFTAVAALVWWFFHQNTLRKLAAQRAELEKQHALNRERERIARDMHDDLGSGLSAIQLLSNFLKNKSNDGTMPHSEIEKIATTSSELNQRVREIIWTMNAGADSVQSLADFLRRYCADFQEIAKTEIRFETSELPHTNISGDLRRNLFFCVKESLNNAAKYAGAEKIKVKMGFENSNLLIEIRDDGKGFDLKKALENGGNGLRNIQKRMHDIGGEAAFETETGTCIQLKINLLATINL